MKLLKAVGRLLTPAFGLVKRFVIGTLDPVAAMKIGVQEVISENVQSPDGGTGKFDFVRLTGFIITLLFSSLFVLYISGVITEEQFNKLIDLLIPLMSAQ